MDNLLIIAAVWSVLGFGPLMYVWVRTKDDWVANLNLVLAGPLVWAGIAIFMLACGYVKLADWISGEKPIAHIERE